MVGTQTGELDLADDRISMLSFTEILLIFALMFKSIKMISRLSPNHSGCIGAILAAIHKAVCVDCCLVSGIAGDRQPIELERVIRAGIPGAFQTA